MKKIFTLFAILISSITITAQEFNYGIALGSFYHDFENEGPLIPGTNYSIIDFGAFGEYQLNSNSGINAKLTYSTKVVDEGYDFRNEFVFTQGEEINFSALNFSAHYKFDTNSEYGKGFYVLAGPRISFISNSKYKGGEKLEDLYEPIRIAGQAGFGVNFLKHFSVELLFDYGLTNPLDSEVNDVQTAGINFNFLINLETILN